jgi:hypothetical protein
MKMRVMLTLDDEQISTVVADELESQIFMTAHEIAAADNDEPVHPEDDAYNRKLIPALFVVYEHFAGEEAVENLKKQVGGWS